MRWTNKEIMEMGLRSLGNIKVRASAYKSRPRKTYGPIARDHVSQPENHECKVFCINDKYARLLRSKKKMASVVMLISRFVT